MLKQHLVLLSLSGIHSAVSFNFNAHSVLHAVVCFFFCSEHSVPSRTRFEIIMLFSLLNTLRLLPIVTVTVFSSFACERCYPYFSSLPIIYKCMWHARTEWQSKSY